MGNVLKQFDLPSVNESDPDGYGITWDGSTLWHSQYEPPVLYNIDPTDGSIIDSVIPQDTIAAIDWINGKLYGFTTFSSNLTEASFVQIDPSDGTFIDTIVADWCIPYALDFFYDGEFLWNLSGPTPGGGTARIYQIEIDLGEVTNIQQTTLKKPEITLYPNPFTDLLTIEGIDQETAFLRVFDSTGKEVFRDNFNQSPTTIDLSQLAPGIYFVDINGTYSKSIVKK
jgi:hypothetical protein